MLIPDITERIRLLHAEVDQLWLQAQRVGSGATIHALVNRLSTARSTLCFVQGHHARVAPDRLDMLLALAEESLYDARVLITQTAWGRRTTNEVYR